jgi:WD40 repeat protein
MQSTGTIPSPTGKKKRYSLFKMFSKSDPDRVRSPSVSSGLSSLSLGLGQDESSEDDKSIDLGSYAAASGPVCFKSLTSSKKQTELNGKLSRLDDEDYEMYLRQPKYIKSFKKSNRTIPICKQLFLAQELFQCTTPKITDQTDTGIEDIQLDDGVEFETRSTSNGEDTKVEETANKNAIWAMRFSLDGKYLASAGKSRDIKIWKVIASPLDRLETSKQNDDGSKNEYASVFQERPYRNYTGHLDDILSLDWSKNNFLLSSSMDKTVKLWNVNQDKVLRTFVHSDFVSSVKFHPTDDRFFISGCLDHKVRLWSILENEVSYEFDAKNLVTAVAFTPNGNLTIVGTFSGTVYFLDTQNLELRHSLDLNRKSNHDNMKITGIESFVDSDDIKVLISANDSKIRLISLRHKQLEFYFKGLRNNSSQIIATVSDDKKYIITASEDHWVYLWDVHKDHESESHLKNFISNKKKRSDYTSFHAHHSAVTCALIAPSGTFKSLSLSNDYIYELNSELNQMSNVDKKRDTLLDESFIGGIIVTADDKGLIRVFRQDFSSNVRKMLLSEKKKRDRDDHKSLGRHLNLSSTSLISRNNSHRGSAMERTTSPFNGRSRSGTVDSLTQRLNFTARSSPSNTPVLCDVCGSDKFGVTKTATGVEIHCTDCGNQIT